MTTTDTSPGFPGEAQPAPADPVPGPREGFAKRRTFTAEYKRQIVAEYDAATRGEKGAILRRERLYDSHIQEWRAAHAAGLLVTGARKGRPPGSARTAEQKRIAELERELRRKDKALAETAAILVLRKKMNAFWGNDSEDV